MTEPVRETPVSQDIPKEEKESLVTVTKETVTPPVHREQDVHHEQKLPVEVEKIQELSKPIVVEKVQEPPIPTVIKTPHKNPEPNKKPEDIQRRNIPRFAHYRSDQ